MTEPRWSPVAEGVYAPAAAALGERGVALFVRGADGELLVFEGDAGGLGPARSLGVPVARVPESGTRIPVEWPIAACGTRDGEIHLLARGAEGDLVHGRYRGGELPGFESIGIPVVEEQGGSLPMGLAGAPAACCRERGRLEIFAVSGEGRLLHTSLDGNGFADCLSLGGMVSSHRREEPVFGAIAAYDAGLRGMGVVVRSMSGDLLVKRWDGGEWRPFAPLQDPGSFDPLDPANAFLRPLSGPPAACGGGSARADVFVRGPKGHLLHSRWDGSAWSALRSIGGPLSTSGDPVAFTAGPIACAWGRYRLDLFATAADGKLYRSLLT